MNVIISNKKTNELINLNIEVIKALQGEYEVNEIISTFKNFFFQKMIIDITAIKNFETISEMEKLALNLEPSRLIILLDDSTKINNNYLASLVKIGIYNFTTNINEILQLYNNPKSYDDVSSYIPAVTYNENTNYTMTGNQAIIAFKDLTKDAGATSLIYMIKKHIEKRTNVLALEVGKRDFNIFAEQNMQSIKKEELENFLSTAGNDVILVDLNESSYENENTFYLLEPSKIKLNKWLTNNPHILGSLKGKKIILNKCLLSNDDIKIFEKETGLKIFYIIPPISDQDENNQYLNNFINSIGI